jgi:NAD(P)-dependent dehydrogenase (short-subunit alcohol dehydrogenase family)
MTAIDDTPAPLADRAILVTGAGEGIGRAVALAAARAGASVILCDVEQSALEPVYDQIEADGGATPAILPLEPDSADETTCRNAADLIGDTFGRLDGLVHCSAFAPFLARIDDYDAAEWERTLRINLTFPFLLTQACLPLLRAAPAARVVFTSDRVGRTGKAYWGAFAAAKFATEGLAQVLADELDGGTAIRVSTIDPGIVRTGLRARLYPGENPMTLPDPETVAPRYLELLGCL